MRGALLITAAPLLQTRILVTHSISFLPEVDDIVVLAGGAVSEHGSYNTLLANKGAFSQFLNLYGNQEEDVSEENTAGTGNTGAMAVRVAVHVPWGNEDLICQPDLALSSPGTNGGYYESFSASGNQQHNNFLTKICLQALC